MRLGTGTAPVSGSWGMGVPNSGAGHEADSGGDARNLRRAMGRTGGSFDRSQASYRAFRPPWAAPFHVRSRKLLR